MSNPINDTQALHATKAQLAIGKELLSISAKNVTESNNLTIDLAMAIFTSKTKFSVRQQADSILWTMQSTGFTEVTDRNEYIHDLCAEFGGKGYTVLIDQKNTIKQGATNTAEEPDYASYQEQIKSMQSAMKNAVRTLSGLVFLRNNGATNIKALKSTTSPHKFIQCEMANGEYKKFNKSGILALAPKSSSTEANKREREQSNARKQGLLLAIVGLNEAIRNEDRTLKDLSKFDSTERAALIKLHQDLNQMMVDQESYIAEYMAEEEAITKALSKEA